MVAMCLDGAGDETAPPALGSQELGYKAGTI